MNVRPGGTILELRASATGTGLGLRGQFVSAQGSNREFVARVSGTGEPLWAVSYPDHAEAYVDPQDRLLVAYLDTQTARRTYRFGVYKPEGDLTPWLQKALVTDDLSLVLPIPGSSDLLLLRSSSLDSGGARLSMDGAVLWSKRLVDASGAWGPMMPVIGHDAGILWVGSSPSGEQGLKMTKMQPDGRVAWTRLLLAGTAAYPTLEPSRDGGWIGHVSDQVSGTTVLRLSPAGQVVWARKYPELTATIFEETADGTAILATFMESGVRATPPAHGAVLIRYADGEPLRGWKLGFQAYSVVATSVGSGLMFHGMEDVRRRFVATQDSMTHSWTVRYAAVDGMELMEVTSVGTQSYLSRFRYGGSECSVLPLLADYSGTPCSAFPLMDALIADIAPRSELVGVQVGESVLRVEDAFDLQLLDQPLDVRGNEVTLRRTLGCPGQAQPNRPPVVVDDGAIVARNGILRLPVSTMLANDTDPDGDAISLASIGVGTQGGVATVSGGEMVYTPPRDWFGYEEIGYEVSDSRGERASGRLWIAVAPERVPELGAMQTSRSGDRIYMHFRGMPGASYTLQGSDELRSWTDIETVTPAPHGYLSWTLRDSRPDQAFYRVRVR